MTGGEAAPTIETPLLYLEDLERGRVFTGGSYVMDERRMKEFAAEFDPQHFHLDHESARESLFGGLAASGWHTAAASMRMLAEANLPIAGGLIGMGGEIAWPRATRPGDRLRLVGEILDVRPSASKPDRGIVTVRLTTLNQDDLPVQIFTVKMVAFRRDGNSRDASKQ